jgi:hypothetical protein
MSNDNYPMMVPNRETVNSAQIVAILQVTNALQAYLLSPHRGFDASEAHPELDGGALAAATVTFCKACEQLNTMLSDQSRWGMDKSGDLYSSIVKTQEAQQAVLAAQKKTLEAALLPHLQFKPQIFQHDGIFLAIYGDPGVAAGHIVGRGHTPEAALYDFDLAFKRLADDQYHIEIDPPDDNPKPKNKK